MRELADMVAVDKSTLSRSLKAGAFSRQVRHSLRNAVDPIDARETVELLVHKALRLISISDRLRERADRMLIEALDQSSGSK